MALTLEIKTQEEWDNYKTERKEKLNILFSTVKDRELVNIILNNSIGNIKLCSARRIGKTYMILARMLWDLWHLSWYNAACIRKYQQQVKGNLLKPMLSIIEDMIKCEIISRGVQSQTTFDHNTIMYDKRKIVFLSIENPNNSLGIQATNNGKHNTQPFFQTIFIDEIIQATDKYSISIEDSLENLDTIRGSLLRGIKSPFESELQEFWAFNPWDAQNQIYQKDIERILPVGQHYITPKMEKKVSENHKKLLSGTGEIWEYKKDEDTLVYRASHLMIPEKRYGEKLKQREKIMKKDNFEKWLCEFAGIHANYSNTRSTYLNNMGKRPEFYDRKKHGEIESVYVGLDRGLRDDTAFSLIGVSRNKEGYKNLIIIDTKTFYASKEETKLNYIRENLDFLIEWFEKINPVSKITILTDGAAHEFNNWFLDHINNNKKLSIYFNLTKALKTKNKNGTNSWDIQNRQDFFNKVFAQRKIFFDKNMETKKIEELWIHFSNCVNDDAGKRNEKPKVNKLDLINSLEYAISYENKEEFNI